MNRDHSASKSLYEKALRVIPGGVNSPVRAFRQVGGEPVYVRSASGARLRDEGGNDYLDFCQSWGPLILGHSHPAVVEAVREAAPEGLSYGACHRREIQLAELVLEAFPECEKIRLVSSGTEAVMTALRVARGVTGRPLVLKFEGGYHGHSDGLLVKAGSGLATHAIASSSGVPEGVARNTLAAPFDDEAAVERLFDAFGTDIAAVVIEPLPANNGLLVQRREFLEFLRDITARSGSLLVFDEVISGFRLKFGGYGQIAGVRPDMVTLGKIIGGGMPVGCVAGPASVMDALSPLGKVYQAGTLSGNPVSLAAGIATLTLLKDSGVYERLENLGEAFDRRLSFGGLAFGRAVREGSIVWPYFDTGEFPRRADAISDLAMSRFTRIYWGLMDDGFYLPPSSYEVMFFSAAHTVQEVEALADALIRRLKEAEGE